MKSKNESNSPVQEEQNSGSRVSQHSQPNTTFIPVIENLSSKNGIANYNFYQPGIYYITSEGVKLPVISRKYVVKQYNKSDFPDEE